MQKQFIIFTRDLFGSYAAGIIHPRSPKGWLLGRSPQEYVGIGKGEMYVFEEDGTILGWSHVRPAMFVALFIDPQHVHEGIGRALFEHGLHIIRNHTQKDILFEATLTAVPFYLKCGCQEVGRSSVCKNDVEVVTVQMRLPAQGSVSYHA